MISLYGGQAGCLGERAGPRKGWPREPSRLACAGVRALPSRGSWEPAAVWIPGYRGLVPGALSLRWSLIFSCLCSCQGLTSGFPGWLGGGCLEVRSGVCVFSAEMSDPGVSVCLCNKRVLSVGQPPLPPLHSVVRSGHPVSRTWLPRVCLSAWPALAGLLIGQPSFLCGRSFAICAVSRCFVSGFSLLPLCF